MVFCYQNCSDLLWEKIVQVIEKNFWNSRLKAENFQKFWDHSNNSFKQWKVRTIFGKVHIFWEGHKILHNLPRTFDCMYCSQKLGEDFAKFCGLLRIYELYQKLFWPFTVWINCSSDLKIFANSWPSASNLQSFFRSLEQFFLAVGQNNFGNKIPFFQVEIKKNCDWNCRSSYYTRPVDSTP
jgi:hypothetical protein